jgi:hypothetical protein
MACFCNTDTKKYEYKTYRHSWVALFDPCRPATLWPDRVCGNTQPCKRCTLNKKDNHDTVTVRIEPYCWILTRIKMKSLIRIHKEHNNWIRTQKKTGFNYKLKTGSGPEQNWKIGFGSKLKFFAFLIFSKVRTGAQRYVEWTVKRMKKNWPWGAWKLYRELEYDIYCVHKRVHSHWRRVLFFVYYSRFY